MTEEARERSFDALASGDVSRREALKWLAAALLGGAALAFAPKVAEAAVCPSGQRKCGTVSSTGLPKCYDPGTEFCCHGHGVTDVCDRATEQCCFLEGGPICQEKCAFCATQVRTG